MKRLGLALLTCSTLALTGLASCASPMPESGVQQESGASADFATESAVPQAESDAIAQNTSVPGESPESSEPEDRASAERPQLIKRASLSLSVDSVEEGFEQVRDIVAAQQGDILSLNDEGDRQRRISFELRVPQDRLDATLDALTEIGSLNRRAITTEDVSSQLVDIQARLNNARKSEAALQEIMSRSGEISDVLEVSRELSNVRQSIEQMAAQQKNLTAQVRYSTINLSLQSEIALAPNKPAFRTQLASSWESATTSVGEFTTDLLQLGLWLLAYSPYLAVLLCGAVAIRKLRRQQAQ